MMANLEDYLKTPSKIGADTLGKIDYELAILASFKLIKDSDYYVHFPGKTALEKIGYLVVILGLIKLLENSDSDVGSNAARMLAVIAEQNTERSCPPSPPPRQFNSLQIRQRSSPPHPRHPNRLQILQLRDTSVTSTPGKWQAVRRMLLLTYTYNLSRKSN